MLKLKNIHLTLGKGSKLERKILNNLDIEIFNGEFVMLIGPNGAGKSTIFNVISAFAKPDYGKVFIDGQDVTNLSPYSRSSFVSKVMQDPRIGTMENMTILENMSFAYKRGQSRLLKPYMNYKNIAIFKEKLSMLNIGLEDRLHELVINLSGGQRQALSLVMSILSNSKILLLDEITAALDPKVAENVMLIANQIIRDEKRTCLMITHNMSHALHYGDRIIILQDGYIFKSYDNIAKSSLSQSDLVLEFNT